MSYRALQCPGSSGMASQNARPKHTSARFGRVRRVIHHHKNAICISTPGLSFFNCRSSRKPAVLKIYTWHRSEMTQEAHTQTTDSAGLKERQRSVRSSSVPLATLSPDSRHVVHHTHTHTHARSRAHAHTNTPLTNTRARARMHRHTHAYALTRTCAHRHRRRHTRAHTRRSDIYNQADARAHADAHTQTRTRKITHARPRTLVALLINLLADACTVSLLISSSLRFFSRQRLTTRWRQRRLGLFWW